MVFTPYDWNQHLFHKSDYVEDRLRDGSPVVGVSFDEGALLLTVRKSQRKVFEIYDRLMYSAIGNQADIESIRNASIDFAHQEGYARSPDDVTAQRLVGFAISPAVKHTFNDAVSGPYVIRALFAELNRSVETDVFLTLNYDGEFLVHNRYAAIGPTGNLEQAMSETLSKAWEKGTPALDQAVASALEAWAVGNMNREINDTESEDARQSEDWRSHLRKELASSTVEAAILERASKRERKFKVLDTISYVKGMVDG